MKRVVVGMLVCMLGLVVLSCINKKDDSGNETVSEQSLPLVNYYETIDEAKTYMGFDFDVPETPEGYELNNVCIRDLDKDIFEINYKRGDDRVCFRASLNLGDISGDSTTFEEEKNVDFEEFTMNIRGNEGKVNIATWINKDVGYAIGSSAGLTMSEVKAMLQ